MRNLLALAGFLALGVAGGAEAATLSYTGTLTFGIWSLPTASATRSGSYVGPTHISTITFTAGQFGSITTSLPVTTNSTIQSVRIKNLANLAGVLTGISGGPPAGGPMGLSGMAKICLIFLPGCGAAVNVPLTPIAATGMGVGGTQFVTGDVALTIYHAPWTVGHPSNLPPALPPQATFTIHTPNTTITTPTLPGGIQSPFSATAQKSGVLQLVTASKVFTSLTATLPEVPVFSILNLHFFAVPTPTPLPVGDIPMCKSKRGRQMTVIVSATKLQRSLDKGLTMGECPDAMNGVVMCKSKRGKMKSMVVPHTKVQRSLEKGLTMGVCRAG